jgi:hypothetical protein
LFTGTENEVLAIMLLKTTSVFFQEILSVNNLSVDGTLSGQQEDKPIRFESV